MLVDEFQDLTPAHLLLIRLLAVARRRGVRRRRRRPDDLRLQRRRPRLADRLRPSCSPGAGDHPLEVNYRCPAGSSTWSTGCCGTTSAAWRRRSAPTRSTRAGGRSTRRSTRSARRRSRFAAHRRRRASGDIAVLTRVNAMLAPVQVALSTARRADRRRGRPRVRRPDVGAQRARLAPAGVGRRRSFAPTTCARRFAARRARSTRGSPTGSASKATSSVCSGSRAG